jgi:predicted transcriptional regulator
MAKLTMSEKYAIQGAVADDKSVAEIAKMLGRPEKTIQKYVETTAESIVKVETVKQNIQDRIDNFAEEPSQAELETNPRVLEEQRQQQFGVHTLTRNVGGVQVPVGAVASKATSDRVDAVRKAGRPSNRYGKDIQPIRRKK